MNDQFLHKLYQAHQDCHRCPRSEEITTFFNGLLGLMFPNFASRSIPSADKLRSGFEHLQLDLVDLVSSQPGLDPRAVAHAFFDGLPGLYDMLCLDVEAIYEGDPAAQSQSEVVRSYPGFFAIAAYRVAHSLWQLGVEIIPRSITEHAHSLTGIDIHPAAEIGSHFCIDHGTGVVIGATTRIGAHVKIYQGVTLGALSVEKHFSEIKRHPTIEDHVVIYAGATILGGNTVIGTQSVIGGNVWLTRSVPAQSKVYYQAQIVAKNQSAQMVISQS